MYYRQIGSFVVVAGILGGTAVGITPFIVGEPAVVDRGVEEQALAVANAALTNSLNNERTHSAYIEGALDTERAARRDAEALAERTADALAVEQQERARAEAEIVRLRSQVGTLQAQVDALNVAVASSIQTITQLTNNQLETVNQLRRARADSTAAVQRAQALASELQDAVAAADTARSAHEDAVAELRQTQSQLEVLESFVNGSTDTSAAVADMIDCDRLSDTTRRTVNAIVPAGCNNGNRYVTCDQPAALLARLRAADTALCPGPALLNP
jgi:hypothetical protein